jgi:hypothetical protein
MTNIHEFVEDAVFYLEQLNGVEWTIEFLFGHGFFFNEIVEIGYTEEEVKKVARDIGKTL